jgi:hypothetical protein
MDMKLKVKPEGREGVWLADKKNVSQWLLEQSWEDSQIHNYIGGGAMLIGANWPVVKVIEWVNKCARLAVLTGDAQRTNMGHALAVIGKDDRLDMFDIGKIAEKDLEAVEP